MWYWAFHVVCGTGHSHLWILSAAAAAVVVAAAAAGERIDIIVSDIEVKYDTVLQV